MREFQVSNFVLAYRILQKQDPLSIVDPVHGKKKRKLNIPVVIYPVAVM